MTDERWSEILDMVSERFTVLERTTVPDPDGHGTIETVTFSGPLGKLKLERTVHERVVGERAEGSKRIGGDVHITKVYDASAHVSTMRCYRFQESTGDWIELQADQLGLTS